jgi:actin cytoskeleton-regulatory complex protein PAN1
MGAPASPTSFGSPPAPSAPSGGGLSGALLSSIQKGKALKKVQTVDKSAPATAGTLSSLKRTNIVGRVI